MQWHLETLSWCRPAAFRTHIIFSKVTLPLSVGLHNHLWGFCLADSYEAGRHSWQCLRKDKTGSYFICISKRISRGARCVSWLLLALREQWVSPVEILQNNNETDCFWLLPCPDAVNYTTHTQFCSWFWSLLQATEWNLNDVGKVLLVPTWFDLDINLDASFQDTDIFTSWYSCSVRRGWWKTWYMITHMPNPILQSG